LNCQNSGSPNKQSLLIGNHTHESAFHQNQHDRENEIDNASRISDNKSPTNDSQFNNEMMYISENVST
jgi:hypothetical protein